MDEGTCQSSSGPPSPSDPRLEDRRQTHRAGGCKGTSAGPEEGPRKSLGSNRPLAKTRWAQSSRGTQSLQPVLHVPGHHSSPGLPWEQGG